MINLSKRSYQKELLDGDDIPFADIQQNMKELDIINSLLGGHKITLSGLKKVIENHKSPFTVCEIGCGGGDNLRAIEKYGKAHNIDINFTGIDIKKECIAYAQQRNQNMKVEWITRDYRAVDFKANKPDVIFSSLFCHHFTEAQLLEMLQWMQRNSRKGFFINDLQRHPLAYYSIKILTTLCSRSYLVKNDAPLSVARGFTKAEWQNIIEQAHINPVSIQWKWAFRYLLTYRHDG